MLTVIGENIIDLVPAELPGEDDVSAYRAFAGGSPANVAGGCVPG
jgi:sugar/nucleoside kinase (ribokinase family)